MRTELTQWQHVSKILQMKSELWNFEIKNMEFWVDVTDTERKNEDDNNDDGGGVTMSR